MAVQGSSLIIAISPPRETRLMSATSFRSGALGGSRCAARGATRSGARSAGRHVAWLAWLSLLALPAGAPNAQSLHPQPAPASGVAADTAHCVDGRTLDLRRILPPPPAAGSPQERAELDELLRIQNSRTSQQIERARRDAKVDVLGFAGALGRSSGLTAASLPLTLALFQHLGRDEFAVLDAAKRDFARPRPFTVDTRLHPIIARPRSASYPSGHATWAYTTALVLADMVPERRRPLLARAGEYAYDRTVAGVHYPSDVAAGRLAGITLAGRLFGCQPFRSEEAGARVELRKALGLPPRPSSTRRAEGVSEAP